MKKLIALLLALMLALVCVSALAADDDTPTGTTPATEGGEGGEGGENNPGGDAENNDNVTEGTELTKYIDAKDISISPTEATTVTLPKRINVEAYESTGAHPALDLKFTVTAESVELSTVALKDAPAVSISDTSIAEDAKTVDLTVNLPAYSAVGIYTYTVTETPTKIAGIVEATNMKLKITVIQDVENNKLVIGGIAFRQEDIKTDEMDNLYKAGSLKVTKTVDGNMGDRTKEFPIIITLTAPTGKTVASTVTYKVNGTGSAATVNWNDDGIGTVEVNLKHDDYVQIDNIPDGVTYTVVEGEAIKHLNAENEEQDNVNAYLVGGEVENKGIVAKELTEETISNKKEIKIDTGVALDFVPYMLIMALALVGFVALKVRRREEY